METQWLPVSLVVWITALAGTLDARQQVRFVALRTGLHFARGRRTVASWLRAVARADYKRDQTLAKNSAHLIAFLPLSLSRNVEPTPGQIVAECECKQDPQPEE